jgi:hypothetical protein
MPFQLLDIVGVGYQPFVKEKRSAIPGLIQAHDKHAELELIEGNAFCRIHVGLFLLLRAEWHT